MTGLGVVYKYELDRVNPRRAPKKSFNGSVEFVNQNGSSDYPDFQMSFTNIKLKIG